MSYESLSIELCHDHVRRFFRTTTIAEPTFSDYVDWAVIDDPAKSYLPVMWLVRSFVEVEAEQ